MRTEPLPLPDARLLTMKVDRRRVSVPEGTTVLHAAELAGVAVPSLCWHKELSAFGGCRLCAVEIAGMRGYPLACSTLAQQGMEVTTGTAALREMRREILQLILSEHPASCLFCGEEAECRRNQKTIRKAGVSTGCRSCTNDGDCELQRVVDLVGITEMSYPVTYRGLEVEHDDPFYDRDYNLCILCGRCVRICDEVRGTSVLSFKYRGRKALIGPAFGNSHVQAGCEFCGACVSVCPTGALADKVSKWDGKPDGVETSTCPFCCVGCRIDVAHKEGALSSVRGALDTEINDGQLCVLGRFCLPETTHHYARARKPMLRRGAYFRVASWDEALGEVAEQLDAVAPDELLMLVSSDLTNEGLYAAQRLVRAGLASGGIDSSGASGLPGGPAMWSRLFSLPISMKALAEAEAVVVAGLDSRFSFSVAGVQVRRAVRRGAGLVVVDARESSLTRTADRWLQATPGEEAHVLARLVRSLCGANEPAQARQGVTKSELASAVRDLQGARALAVVVGPRVFDCRGAEGLVAALEALCERDGVTVLPLVHGANVRGALELGALADVLPGPRSAEAQGLSLAELQGGRRPKVLYLVGDVPFETRPDCDFLIAQDMYLPPFEVDAFLPAASFAEADGTLTNIEGRVQEQRRVEDLPAGALHGFALPDWQIFSDLATRLGRPDLRYADAPAVRTAIRADVPDFPGELDRSPRRMTPIGAGGEREEGSPEGKGRFLLVSERPAFRHRSIDLAGVVEGLGELHLEDGLHMSPDDIDRLGVEPGGVVTVSADEFGSRRVDLVLAVLPDPDCPAGAVYLSRVETVTPSQGLAAHPVRVRIRAGDRTPARKRAEAEGGQHRARTQGGEHGPGR